MKVGDRILVETKDKKVEGVLMPSVKEGSLVLKMDSGYNLGVSKKKVVKTKVLKKYVAKKVKKKVHKHSKNKKTVAILHTGGTIASKVDYETGGVVAQFSPEELIAMFPELEKKVNLNSRLMRNMFSEDLRFDHYNLIAKEIQKEIKKGVDGVIITHGTDTIHYTSAALSFILEGLGVPVIIVGAQRSSDRGSSDAAINLISAVEFICNSDFAEVGVCMHKDDNDEVCWILPGLKCRKMHSSRRDTFKPVNVGAYAEVEYKTGNVNILDNKFAKREKKTLKLKLFKDVKVGVVKAYPGMNAEIFKCYSKYDGLVLEGTGLGHFPVTKLDKFTEENEKIFDAIRKIALKVPVVMSLQTIFGRVDMNVYSNGRKLVDIGILGNYSDMTPETSYIKLAWLLSNYPSKVREMFMEDLRGELSKRTNKEFL